jgi:hypothetical protein
MGNYNVDNNYNLPQMVTLARNYDFLPDDDLYSDQWSIDSANRVASFHDGTGLHKIHFLFDPREIPPG